MAIFNYGDNERHVDNGKSPTTIVTQGAHIKGELNLECDLYVDGTIEGTVESSKSITIGKHGKVDGEVRALHLIVQGVAKGSIDADRIEIKEGGRISGMVASNELVIEPKGLFEGESRLKASKESLKERLGTQQMQKPKLPKST